MEKSNVFVGGAMFAAFVSSLCCVLPLIAVVFGLGAFGTAAIFETVRYPMIFIAFAALAYGFYRVYFRREECAEGESCATKPVSRINKIFLWVGAIVIVAFALAPQYTGYMAAAITSPSSPATEPAPVVLTEEPVAKKTIVLQVRGMTCEGCEAHIEVPLRKLRGVITADADYKQHNVTVVYDSAQTTVEKIKEAITATGYELI
ncbi:MAG TPA: mercuric transporter MerT family protein [Pyrinomonadaceae bacterium]|nr:mercuric transporter MerT family protein [Pyrinomonadaceae bacterium]